MIKLRFHKLVGDIVEVVVDLDTASVVQVVNRLTGAKHLLARKPELEIKTVPGMGIVELEPFYCTNWVVNEYTNREFTATCKDGTFVYTKRVVVESGKAVYSYCVTNVLETSVDARLRSALYLACGKGGFWGDEDVLGATYSCRHYVLYGFKESWGSFSTVKTPDGSRGFFFEKHSYRSRWFPELKWIAVLDRNSREGLAVKCINTDCYGVVEDQFFNVEVNLVIPSRRVPPGSSTCLVFEIIPFTGLGRVDYVGELFIAGVETPSVASIGAKLSGELSVFPLINGELRFEGYLVYVRDMQSIGKRGYCVDRVVHSTRKAPLAVNKSTIMVEKYKPVKVGFETSLPLKWSFEEELYEIPYVVFDINGVEVRRAISINPDVEDALDYVPEHLRKFAWKLVQENPVVESEFMEREASKPIYELVLYTRFNPRKILVHKLKPREEVKRYVAEYLKNRNIKKYIELWSVPISDPRLLSSTPVLDIALVHLVTGSRDALNALVNVLQVFSNLVLDGAYVTYYSPIHGGGGSDRFADFVLALDLVEDYIDKNIVENVYVALSFLGREISKITNTWTGNWELSEATALLAIAYKLGYLSSDVDVYKALATAKRALESFLPDGAWPELAASYHVASVSHLIKIGEISSYAGLFDLFNYRSSSIREEPVIRRALTWLWSILTPRHTTPAIEDTNEFTPEPDIFLLPGLHLNDEDLLAIAFKLEKISKGFANPYTYLRLMVEDLNPDDLRRTAEYKPRKRLVVFENSGRLVFRDSEDTGSLYFILDYGSQGGWHGHPDRLSFELYYREIPVVVDSGSGGYYNPLHWTWNRRTIAHNTITIGESDHPENIRGKLLDLRKFENGFYALFRLDLNNSTWIKRFTLLNSIEKVLVIHDLVNGHGVFRWNIHCRGVIKAVSRGVINFEVDSLPYILVVPDNVTINVREGFRGPVERVPYLYYEVKVDGKGSLWGVVVLEEEHEEKAVKKAMKYLDYLNTTFFS